MKQSAVVGFMAARLSGPRERSHGTSKAQPASTQVPISTATQAYVPGAASVRAADALLAFGSDGSVLCGEDRDDGGDMGTV
jgi:hypothetical protein